MSDSLLSYYIFFNGNGSQTWSLENICANLTNGEQPYNNQQNISDGLGNVTYSKKINVAVDCGIIPSTKTPEPQPTYPSNPVRSPWPAIKTSIQIRPTTFSLNKTTPFIIKPIDSGSGYLMPLLVAFGGVILASAIALYCL